MRSRNNGGVIGAYVAPTTNHANGVFFIHDAAIYNTGLNPTWPLASGFIYDVTGGVVALASDNPNWKTHTFTANGLFTILEGAGPLEILLVGGGGAGGKIYNNGGTASSFAGGGGGGGGVVVVSTWAKAGDQFTVTVGPGGVGTGATLTKYNGGQSVVTSTAGHYYLALGGGGGGIGMNTVGTGLQGNQGGSSGGNGYFFGQANNSSILALQPSSESGGYGGDGANSYNWIESPGAGGGGGAGGAGHPGRDLLSVTESGEGGDGYLWPRTNSYYGAGGGGGRRTAANTNPSAVWAGASGPYPGTNSRGYGAVSGTLSGSTAGNSALSDYGAGGGGAAAYNSQTMSLTVFGGSGGSGTVIFCYRYK